GRWPGRWAAVGAEGAARGGLVAGGGGLAAGHGRQLGVGRRRRGRGRGGGRGRRGGPRLLALAQLDVAGEVKLEVVAGLPFRPADAAEQLLRIAPPVPEDEAVGLDVDQADS